MRVLIVINNLGRNGAPTFALDVCDVLSELGYECTVWSMKDGPLRDDFSKKCRIEVVNFYEYSHWDSLKEKYELAVLFTIQSYLFYSQLAAIIPSLWYIHEGKNIANFFENTLCYEIFKRADNIVVVSEYVQELLTTRYSKESKVIHNFVNDSLPSSYPIKREFPIRFLVAGSYEIRKGFDVALDAFGLLSTEEKTRCELLFCGARKEKAPYVLELYDRIKNISWVKDLGELSRDKTMETIREVDYVVVPSRDESCSLVAIEALMLGKPIIISDSVGAKYLVDNENGWVFESENSKQLFSIIKAILKGGFDYELMSKAARRRFEVYGTRDHYMESVKVLLSDVMNSKVKEKSFSFEKIVNMIQPFDLFPIPSSSRLILYGAGKNGKAWYRILSVSNDYTVVLWVDKFVKEKDIESIDKIDMMDEKTYDYILITIEDRSTCRMVREELLSRGVLPEKILFQSDCSTWMRR